MMHDKGLLESTAKNGVKNDAPRPKADKICGNHVLSERKRREKLNQRFMILKTLVPSNNKFFCVFGGLWFDIHVTECVEHNCLSSVAFLNSLAFFMNADKVSILDDTIKYLERRVEELVTCSELMELETRTKRQPRDGVERTSDNYGSNKNITSRKKKYVNKRKASDIGEAELEIECVASKDNVVVIQFRCPWRDGLDALSNSQFGLPFSSIIHHSGFSHSL
ncbi:hypothetical protein GOBAR_AA08400 [Gossypium barbadense]|uniref:BHLH domain-containing protein n=2 Tax=Gossypium TaxID=3633 RepID=A0A2P5Y9F5_GOSBA|nr:hypothetical protein GOBAR_AA08400 [Gossypium barbadense]